ncbi:zf-TFIIB domain-containing protein [Loktanella sp. 3ANDIMAR09]
MPVDACPRCRGQFVDVEPKFAPAFRFGPR